VQRISINPQTMNDETLKIIGRRHTVSQVEQAFETARNAGFNNINMDIIMGLPGEDVPEIKNTLEKIKKLSPESLTVHSLAIKRAAALNIWRDKYRDLSLLNSDEIMAMTESCSGELGMKPYYMYRQKNMAGNFENVGYSRIGKECIYNILIMEEKQTIVALGAGATTKRVYPDGRIERCENVKDVASYIDRVDEMVERKRELFDKKIELA
jgi:oxygen-independent coproporphyrinogen-3 oxidase